MASTFYDYTIVDFDLKLSWGSVSITWLYKHWYTLNVAQILFQCAGAADFEPLIFQNNFILHKLSQWNLLPADLLIYDVIDMNVFEFKSENLIKPAMRESNIHVFRGILRSAMGYTNKCFVFVITLGPYTR